VFHMSNRSLVLVGVLRAAAPIPGAACGGPLVHDVSVGVAQAVGDGEV
jgi:hypothetical protein